MKKYIIIGVAVLIFLSIIGVQQKIISARTNQRDTARRNTNALLEDVRQYRVSDSLNMAQVGSLTLEIDDYKRFRQEDAALIAKMRANEKSLRDIITAQTSTITKLENIPIRDSIIYLDGRVDTIRCMSYSDRWLDFTGCENGSVSIETRDAFILTTNIEYKRALGFLWRTKKIKSQQSSALSKNPRTIIVDMEHVIISK